MRQFATTACVALVTVLALGAGVASRAPRAVAEDVGAEVDVSVFYEPLAQHGTWLYVAPYGWTWQPRDVDVSWRPYVDDGYWMWTDDYGWTWYSEYEWGWAPFHYGRWHFDGLYGWVWVPGTVWAPAWVAWRSGSEYVGWYPLPPEVEYRESFVLNVDLATPRYALWWTFVPATAFVETRLTARVIASPWNAYLLRRTQDSTRYVSVSGGVANRSLEVSTFERAGARVQRRRIHERAAANGAARAEGDTVILFRPRIKAGPASRPPKAVTPSVVDLAARRERMERFFDEQRKATVAAKPPPGLSDVEAKAAAEEHRSAIDEQRKRVAEDEARAKRVDPPRPGESPRPPGAPDEPKLPKPVVPAEAPKPPRVPAPTPKSPSPGKTEPTPPEPPGVPPKPPEQPPAPPQEPIAPPPEKPPLPPEKEKDAPKDRKKSPEELEEEARLEKERKDKEEKERKEHERPGKASPVA